MTRVVLAWSAEKELSGLDPVIARRILAALQNLRDDPHPQQSMSLRGQPGYQLRVGKYRVIYAVANDVVTVLAIGHRREIYD